MAGLFHPLLCSFCGFTALFPKGTVLLQLLFPCLFQGVTLFCVFPVVDRQCLVLARQCRKKKRKKSVGLKDGGEEGEVYIFFYFFCKSTNYCVSQCSWLREVGVSLKGNELVNCAPDGPKWTAQNITEWRGEG